MSDNYQAVYDAVRSKISGVDLSRATEDVLRETFGHAGFLMQQAAQEQINAAYEMQRPSVVFKPRIYQDGNMHCVLLGENIQDGVAGFGETVQIAMVDFDNNFNTQKCYGA